MELRQYVDVMRRRWRVVVVPGVLLAAGAAAFTAFSPPTYTSSATLYLQAGSSGADSGGTDAKLASYVTLVNGPTVATGVIEQLKLSTGVNDLRKDLSARADPGSLLLTLTARGDSPAQSQQIAAAAADQVIERATLLDPAVQAPQGSAATTATGGGLTVAERPTPGESTWLAGLIRNTLLAGIFGLLIGIVGALVRESLDNRVTASRQLRDDARLTTLASIPLDPAGGSPGVLLHDPKGPWAEAFRRLRTKLLPAGERRIRTVVITGCIPAAGTTTTVCGLGITMARAGLRVVVVGADLRHPTLADQLWRRNTVGLTDVLAGNATLDDVLTPWGDGLLSVLPSGSPVSNPGELLGSDAMAKLITSLEGRFDMVLVEAPPLLPYADAVILSSVAGSGVILAVRHGRTDREQVQEAVGLLEDSGIGIHGTVLTMVPGRVKATEALSWRQRRARRRGAERSETAARHQRTGHPVIPGSSSTGGSGTSGPTDSVDPPDSLGSPDPLPPPVAGSNGAGQSIPGQPRPALPAKDG